MPHGRQVRCPKCREEFFVPYSCRVRCFCPSCHEKRALEKAGWVAEHICAEVPHRQFVFTIPKRLRIYFRFERRLLGELCRAAARTVITVYRAASGRPDALPGMVGALQTFGQLIHWHPHIHALVSEGVAQRWTAPWPGKHLQARILPPLASFRLEWPHHARRTAANVEKALIRFSRPCGLPNLQIHGAWMQCYWRDTDP
ncbi:MAG: transposase [Verrucomicrobia bacterium]|nr:transposase [Verrucomicrobiota bacterium]